MSVRPIKSFGLAQHGLVKGGVLTLPTGAQVSREQPYYNYSHAIDLGQKPGVDLSASEMTALADDGLELRDYALSSGFGRVSRFIHQSNDGRRWDVDISGLILDYMGLSFTGTSQVVFKEFGRMPHVKKEEEQAVVTVVLPYLNLQQNLPSASYQYLGETINLRVNQFRILSTSPNGERAIIGLFFNFLLPPIGFLLLTIDDLAPVLSVYRSRQDTLGAYSLSEVVPDYSPYNLVAPAVGSAYWVAGIGPNVGEDDYYSRSTLEGVMTIDESLVDRIFFIGFDDAGVIIDHVLSFSSSLSVTFSQSIISGATLFQNSVSSAASTSVISANGHTLTETTSHWGSSSTSRVYSQSQGTMEKTVTTSFHDTINGVTESNSSSAVIDVTGNPAVYQSFHSIGYPPYCGSARLTNKSGNAPIYDFPVSVFSDIHIDSLAFYYEKLIVSWRLASCLELIHYQRGVTDGFGDRRDTCRTLGAIAVGLVDSLTIELWDVTGNVFPDIIPHAAYQPVLNVIERGHLEPVCFV